MKKVTINIPDDCEVQVVRKEAKFKKGDIVISRGGKIAIYEKTDFMPETENKKVLYYSTLYNPYSKSFISIVDICDVPNNLIEGNILWEKPQEVVLTMQDIADKFGISVEQLRIKK